MVLATISRAAIEFERAEAAEAEAEAEGGTEGEVAKAEPRRVVLGPARPPATVLCEEG